MDKDGLRTVNSAIISDMADCPFKVRLTVITLGQTSYLFKHFWRGYCIIGGIYYDP